MAKIAVVILNWNGRKFLEQFLPSVISNSPSAEIIIADNNSSDDSIDYLEKEYPHLRVITIPENGGYSKGYNIALRQIDAEYYILLNSDIEVTPGWIEPVVKLMDSDKTIAACQPKIRSYYNKEYFEYAGAAGGLIDKMGYPFCRGRIFDALEKDEGQFNDTCEIFWATGACLFVRAEQYHEIGGLDDDFFAHLEEIDLCWRLKNAGYKIFYCGESEIYHVGGGTLSKLNPQKTYLNFRNSLYMLFKNLESKRLFRAILLRLVLDGIAGMKFLFTDSYKHTFAIIKAHFSFYSNIGSLRKKRSAHVRDAFKYKEVYKKSIVFDYYIKGKRKFSDLKF